MGTSGLLVGVLPILLCALVLEATAQRAGSNPPPPSPSSGTCPPTCNCSGGPSMVECMGGPDIEVLSFEEMGLTEVPRITGLYGSLEVIDLSGNFIERVRTGALGSERTPKLRTIILEENRIRILEPNAFRGPLQTINLEENQIETFDTRSFTGIRSTLETLSLSDNRITDFEFESPFNGSIFPSLTIDLSDNPIPCDPNFPSYAAFAPLCESFISPTSEAECFHSTGLQFSLVAFCNLIKSGESASTTVAPGSDNSNVRLTIGLSVGLPVLAIFILVLLIILFIWWRVKIWERKFTDVTDAQVETNLRLRAKSLTSTLYRDSTDPRYISGHTFHPPTPPPPYNKHLLPGGSAVFFPSSDEEGLYECIDGRPLPSIPGPCADPENENGYILEVESIPRQDVLPGIAIAKRREVEAARLSKYKPPQKLEPKEIAPYTDSESEDNSDTETENKESPPSSHKQDTTTVSLAGSSDEDELPAPSKPPQESTLPEEHGSGDKQVESTYQEIKPAPNDEETDLAASVTTSGTDEGVVAAPTEVAVKKEGEVEESDDQEVYLALVQ